MRGSPRQWHGGRWRGGQEEDEAGRGRKGSHGAATGGLTGWCAGGAGTRGPKLEARKPRGRAGARWEHDVEANECEG